MLFPIEVAEDRRVVVRTDGEGTAGEVTTLLKRGTCPTSREDLVEGRVVGLRRDDDDILEVLSSATDEADTPDIDLLDNVFFASARGDSSFEGV